MIRLLLAAALLATPAVAQMAEPAPVACVRQEIVPGFEAWGTRAGDALAIGMPATLRLGPAEQARFVPPPARPLAPGSHAGAFALEVAKAGTYRIAVGAKAWIEVVREGERRTSIGHVQAPACSGIRKIVDFALEPGRYEVQISEAAAPTIGAMIVAK